MLVKVLDTGFSIALTSFAFYYHASARNVGAD